MDKKEITVTFGTITPLWTGDAWQNNREIRPSALIGSLRFWFETIMYFADVLKKEDFNSQSGRFEKEVNRKKLKEFIQEHGNDINEIIKYLIDEQQIPISSVIFGTTNWKSLIEIKKIEPIEDYCFGNRLDLPYAIGIKKDNYDIEEFNTEDEWKEKINQYSGRTFKDKLQKARKKYSFFFFSQPYFYGKFKVKFFIEERILNSIFYPFLTFMDKYGFWGGKWNIGYGRLKVESVNINLEKIDLQIFDFKTEHLKKFIKFSDILKFTNDFNELIKFNEEDKRIKIFEHHFSDDNFKESVKELIKFKAQERANYRINAELRHKIFGTTKSPPEKDFLPQGSKVFPYIDKTERNKFPYSYGFLSIAGLLNLEGKN